MKKLIFIILFIVLIGFMIFKDKGYNPYSGTYRYTGQENLVLRLNKDNSYILYYPVGKRDAFVKGKYEVVDNSIALTPGKENVNKFMAKSLHGKVEGARIILVEYNGDFIKY